MKPLNAAELARYVEWIAPQLSGAQLQDVYTDGEVLVFEMYGRGESASLQAQEPIESFQLARKGSTLFLLIDLRPAQPFLVFLNKKKVALRKKNPKPVALFLASHGENLFLDDISMIPAKGRVLTITFRNIKSVLANQSFARNTAEGSTVGDGSPPGGSTASSGSPPEGSAAGGGSPSEGRTAAEGRAPPGSRRCEVEIVLIPHVANVTVRADGKTISWNRPKEIPETHAVMIASDRDWESFAQEYMEWRWTTAIPGAVSSREKEQSSWLRSIEKKKTALEKIRAAADPAAELKWRAFGDFLKMSNHPSEEFQDLWDKKLNLRDNRERAFKKAKEQAAKRAGAQARIATLAAEIAALEERLASPATATEEKASPAIGTVLLRKTDSKGRSLNLKSGAQAIVGRSAKDNLALLRQARAWDFWIHLKDEPSAHAIIFRNKNQSISREEIAEVAQWVLQSTSGKKLRLEGTKVDVVIVECRFVRPIKGDRLGRVTYHSPTVHSVTFVKPN